MTADRFELFVSSVERAYKCVQKIKRQETDEIISGVVQRANQGLAEEEREVFYRAFGKIAANRQRYFAEKEGMPA